MYIYIYIYSIYTYLAVAHTLHAWRHQLTGEERLAVTRAQKSLLINLCGFLNHIAAYIASLESLVLLLSNIAIAAIAITASCSHSYN